MALGENQGYLNRPMAEKMVEHNAAFSVNGEPAIDTCSCFHH